MKRFSGVLVAGLLFGGLGWGGGYLYWHIRLVGAIRTLESRSGPQGSDGDAADVIRDAGCKALPYLIGAMQPKVNPYFLAVASSLLKDALREPIARGDREVTDHLQDWMISIDTTAEERKRKCDDLHAWWREKGESRHSAVQWWKRDCGGL